MPGLQLLRPSVGADWSDGDLVTLNSAAVNNKGQKADIRHGTAAAPFVGEGSTFKVSQVSAITQAIHDSWVGIGVGGQTQDMGALSAAAFGTAASEVQVSAITAFASNKGTTGKPDACPIFTYAWQKDAGAIGRAISLYAAARNDLAGGKLTGIEIQAQNKTGSFIEAITNGVPDAVGLLISAGSGTYQGGGAGINFHHPEGWAQLDVGISAVSSNGGPFKNAFLRDSSEAAISLDVRGKHSFALRTLTPEAGAILIGAEKLSGESPPQLFEVNAGGISKSALMKLTGGGNVNVPLVFNNSTANFTMGIAGSTNGLMTGTAAGDGAIGAASTKSLHLGRLGATADIRVGGGVGFYGTAPVAKQTGVAKTAEAVWTALNALGLIA